MPNAGDISCDFYFRVFSPFFGENPAKIPASLARGRKKKSRKKPYLFWFFSKTRTSSFRVFHPFRGGSKRGVFGPPEMTHFTRNRVFSPFWMVENGKIHHSDDFARNDVRKWKFSCPACGDPRKFFILPAWRTPKTFCTLALFASKVFPFTFDVERLSEFKK